MTKSIAQVLRIAVFAVSVVGLFSISAAAADVGDVDLTVFGGIQRPGKLTFESAQGTGTNLIRTFDPKTFGVFGARVSHGKVLGGEHTFAYAPNFIQSDSNAFIYHSNIYVQAPLPVFKPYGSAGLGLIHTGGDSNSFGTNFAVNYGGGLKALVGPIGVNVDVRGYTVPKVEFTGFEQQRLNFIQVTAGIVISLKK